MDFEVTPVPKRDDFQKTQSIKGWFSAIKTLRLLIWFSIGLVIFAIIFFLFIRVPFRVSGVDFNIEGPTEASAGEEVIYVLKYKNNTSKRLERVRISFFYPPDSIVLKDGEISDTPSEIIELNNLLPNQEGQKELHAFINGNKGSVKTAKATFSFRPEKVRSDFRIESELSTRITSIPISLTLVAPPNAVPGQEITYLLDYRNESDDD